MFVAITPYKMLLILLLVTVLGRVAESTRKLQWSESKFVFKGDPSEYVKAELGETSLAHWAMDDIYYHQSSARVITIGTWIKPEHQDPGVNQFLLEFDMLKHYQVLIINDTFAYTEWDVDTGNTTSYTCTGVYSLAQWNLLMVQVTYTMYSHDTLLTLALKPLDKTSPFTDLRCHLDAGILGGRRPSNASHAVLGRGFAGQMTPIFVDAYYDSAMQRMKTCLKTTALYVCRQKESSRSQHHRYDAYYFYKYLAHIDYTLDTSMSIRRDVDTEIGVFFNTNFTCKDGNVSVELIGSHFAIPAPYYQRERYHEKYYGYRYRDVYRYPANVTLGTGNNTCNLTWAGGDKFKLADTPLTSCGFQSTPMDNTTVLYHNTVNVVTSHNTTQLMSVACWYRRPSPVVEEITVAAYAVQKLELATLHSTTPWKMELKLYGDGNFTQRLDNPVLLHTTGSVIYVEGTVTYSDVTRVALVMETCKTRVALNTRMHVENTLIEDSVAVDDDVTLLESSPPSVKRFAFKPHVFEDFPRAVVHLTCTMKASEIEEDK